MSDEVEVAVGVHADVVVQCGDGEEQVWDRSPVPQAMVVGEVTLQMLCCNKDVGR